MQGEGELQGRASSSVSEMLVTHIPKCSVFSVRRCQTLVAHRLWHFPPLSVALTLFLCIHRCGFIAAPRAQLRHDLREQSTSAAGRSYKTTSVIKKWGRPNLGEVLPPKTVAEVPPAIEVDPLAGSCWLSSLGEDLGIQKRLEIYPCG